MNPKTLEIIDLMLKDMARMAANQDFLLYKMATNFDLPQKVRTDAASRAVSEAFNIMVTEVREIAN